MLLLQEFDFKVKDRKGCKNQVIDHLSMLENKGSKREKLEIDNSFSDEQVLTTTLDLVPWFADFINYLMSNIIL